MAHGDVNSRMAESERRFATLIDNLPGVTYRCLKAPDWPMEFISDGVLALTGYAATEFLRSDVNFGSLVHAEDQAGVWEGVQAATEEKKPYRLQYRLKTASGEERWVWEQGRGVYGPDGELEALEGFITDITEQKRAEEEISAQASTIRALMESAAEAIIAIDGAGRIVLANAALEQMFGLSPEEAIGQSVETLLPERFREAHAGHRAGFFSQPRQRRMGASLDLVGMRKDGTEFPVEVSLGYINRPEAPLAVAFISDITDRNHTEEALRQSETRSRAILDALPDLVFRIASDGTYLDCRVPEPSLMAMPAEAIIGKVVRDILPTELASSTMAAIGRALEKNHSQVFDYVLTPLDGQPLTFEARVSPSGPDEVLVVARDITERIEASRKLEQRETALRESQDRLRRLAGQLISTQEEASSRIARDLHDDFGQRLAGLVMQISVLEHRLSAADESVRQKLQRINKGIGELADDCQKLSRRMHSSILEKLGLEAALKAECASLAEQAGTEVVFRAEEDLAKLEPKSALCLYRVAQEALRNIVKHARASRVDVILAKKPAGVVLRIRDDGVGFDMASARRSQGLGLTSMEERVRSYGGRVSLTSELSKGTTLEVLLPMARQP